MSSDDYDDDQNDEGTLGCLAFAWGLLVVVIMLILAIPFLLGGC